MRSDKLIKAQLHFDRNGEGSQVAESQPKYEPLPDWLTEYQIPSSQFNSKNHIEHLAFLILSESLLSEVKAELRNSIKDILIAVDLALHHYNIDSNQNYKTYKIDWDEINKPSSFKAKPVFVQCLIYIVKKFCDAKQPFDLFLQLNDLVSKMPFKHAASLITLSECFVREVLFYNSKYDYTKARLVGKIFTEEMALAFLLEKLPILKRLNNVELHEFLMAFSESETSLFSVYSNLDDSLQSTIINGDERKGRYSEHFRLIQANATEKFVKMNYRDLVESVMVKFSNNLSIVRRFKVGSFSELKKRFFEDQQNYAAYLEPFFAENVMVLFYSFEFKHPFFDMVSEPISANERFVLTKASEALNGFISNLFKKISGSKRILDCELVGYIGYRNYSLQPSFEFNLFVRYNNIDEDKTDFDHQEQIRKLSDKLYNLFYDVFWDSRHLEISFPTPATKELLNVVVPTMEALLQYREEVAAREQDQSSKATNKKKTTDLTCLDTSVQNAEQLTTKTSPVKQSKKEAVNTPNCNLKRNVSIQCHIGKIKPIRFVQAPVDMFIDLKIHELPVWPLHPLNKDTAVLMPSQNRREKDKLIEYLSTLYASKSFYQSCGLIESDKIYKTEKQNFIFKKQSSAKTAK